ncbi:MAG: AbgT family transporter [Bacilli bacterium]
MKMNKLKEKITLNPIMTFIILILGVIMLSWILNLVGFNGTYNKINPSTGEYVQTTEVVESLISIEGIKYIFSSTVSNFATFTPLSMLIISLIGIGVMEKSGFLKTAITLLTKHSKKTTITFVWVLLCIISTITGDIAYVVAIPLGALIFSYGRRNPILGVVVTFAALTCGSGISLFASSIDTALMTTTLQSANVLDKSYTMSTLSFIIAMTFAIIALALVITQIAEKYSANNVEKYEFKEEKKEFKLGKKEARGLLFSLSGGILYLIIFIYNIIPGLPLSGKLLDDTQTYYIDKLFSYNSFFSNGFVFIVTMLFIILGLLYGIGARTIKNNNDLCDDLGHSLDGTGKILVKILFASILINVFKKSNIGPVVVATLANLINSVNITGIPLIIVLFLISAITTFLVPSSTTKWAILASTAIPAFMNSGLTPEFAQVVFRFGECAAMGLTPLFAYYVIYLSYIEKYNQNSKPIAMFRTLKYQLPYSIITGITLIIILLGMYLTGIPLGIESKIII